MELDRITEIYHRPSQAYGSGYLVVTDLVLTARHVVVPKGWEDRVGYGENYRVRIGGTEGQTLAWRDARLIWRSPTYDAALLRLIRDAAVSNSQPFTLTPLGKVLRDGEPVLCRAVGFPKATERAGIDDTHDLGGEVRPGGTTRADLLWVDLTTNPPKDPKDWHGMSGAALFCWDRLIGVVTNYTPEFGSKVLQATPLTNLRSDQQFCALITGNPNGEICVEPVNPKKHLTLEDPSLSDYIKFLEEEIKRLLTKMCSPDNATAPMQYSLAKLHSELIDKVVKIDESYEETNRILKEVTGFLWGEWEKTGMPDETDFVGGYATVEKVAEELSKLAEDDRAKHDSQRRAYIHFLHGCLIINLDLLDYERALEQFELACRIDPNNPRYFHAAGEEAMKACRFPDAEKYFTNEIRLLKRTSPDSNSSLARAYNDLGGALDQQYRFHDAVNCFEKAAELLSSHNNESKDRLGLAFNNLGGAYAGLQLFSEAEALYVTAKEFFKESKGSNTRLYGLVMNNLAEVKRQLNRPKDAERILNDTLLFLRRVYSKNYPKHPIIAKTYNNLGALQLVELRLPKKAKESLEEAVRLYHDNNIPDFFPPKIASLHNLALACWEVSERDELYHEANSCFNRALGGAERSFGNDNPITCAIREDYDSFQKEFGKEEFLH